MRTLLAALLLLPLLLAACANPGTSGPGGDDPKSLPAIRLYNSALGIGDYMVEINTVGDMTVQERRGPTETAVHRSTLRLTPEQINTVQTAFKGWKKLKSSYPGEWSALVQITYDGYTVDVHDLPTAPPSFTNAMVILINLARTAVAASTQPATTSETAPTPATPSPNSSTTTPPSATPTPSPILVPRN